MAFLEVPAAQHWVLKFINFSKIKFTKILAREKSSFLEKGKSCFIGVMKDLWPASRSLT
jgi:hypothetical protein